MIEERTYESIFIAKQPIFDAQNETWGYMMLFRDSQEAEAAVITDNSEATMSLVANLPLCNTMGGNQARFLIHFTPKAVIRGIPHAIPWDNTVIILEEAQDPDETLIIALGDLLIDGYELAINNFEGKPGCERLAELADTLIVDMEGKDEADLDAIMAKAKKFGPSRMIAKRVENAEEHAKAKAAGFNLFHGYFYKRPQTESGRKISSSKATRLKLFDIIEKEEPDFDALAPAIEADVAISYRLLNFLNSANFSFATKVTSIKQAIVLTGWKPLRNWLRLIILTDLTPSEKTLELAYTSAHRAKLFETAALGSGYEEDSDTLFIVGLFSLLDAMLGTEMKEITDHLPVDDEVSATLCGKKTKYSPWLDLSKAIEESDWDKVGSHAKTLGLLPGTVAVSYQHAFTWADAFFSKPIR
ncbi:MULTISPECIES: HDOD domain-containing protein [unclassified Pseudodesulfovibrio]|uniref:EAL and HDOD domain-containing protein n=1 Tax=unclassified Pseudodesulfovibrio TaxID=2661612 RepID=UPI000FEC1677|nr:MULTISPECIES: HDOD domain-containing protein [unclassified Pseudodesulfovibrio]MCJ2166011.1 HDOD domain-containing protein [Pseudodesulfovibrio sp. S3-i]RWU02550.1 HDOD domain-containing protein [Pseudodesulfovibrio sp. S3]